VRHEVFTAVRMMFFWVLAPCRLAGRCQRFGETLHLQLWRWRQFVSPKRWHLPASLKILSPSSALKMETVRVSETLASTGESTRRQNPEDHHHPHRRENLISRTLDLTYIVHMLSLYTYYCNMLLETSKPIEVYLVSFYCSRLFACFVNTALLWTPTLNYESRQHMCITPHNLKSTRLDLSVVHVVS
jgi:hypothetical protein